MRVYVIFYGKDAEAGHYLYVPIKRNGYAYAGMPQFFGGGVNQGETPDRALEREVSEESDRKISFDAKNKKSIHNGTAGGEQFHFYMSNSFEGSSFLGPLDRGEMSSIQRVYIPEDDPDYVIDDMLQSLKITPSEEFSKSETYKAFEKALGFLRK